LFESLDLNSLKYVHSGRTDVFKIVQRIPKRSEGVGGGGDYGKGHLGRLTWVICANAHDSLASTCEANSRAEPSPMLDGFSSTPHLK
jgi:hypothetical protein